MVDARPLTLDGLLLLTPRVYPDARGFYMVTYEKEQYHQAGVAASFVQDNLSFSEKGTLRGLHYQIRHAQGKLIQVMEGEIFDVAVDLRADRLSFGQWESVRLSAASPAQLWVPPGFAHGFYVVSDTALVAYKVSDIYDPEAERSLAWDDPELAIDWPLADQPPLLSAKDAAGVKLKDAEVYR